MVRLVFLQSSRLPSPRRAAPAVFAVALAVLLAGAGSWHFAVLPLVAPVAQAAQNASPSVCNLETTERIVAVGDVHGAYTEFVAILRAAGLIDARDRWIGGRARLVQTGDVVDRGTGSRRALDLLRKLERDADRAGGRVYALLGNHEVMRLTGDWRYVSAAEYAEFRNGDSEALRERIFEAAAQSGIQQARREGTTLDMAAIRERFMKETPLGSIEMIQAFGPTGEYGRWLRTHDTIIRINGIVFVHGGVDAAAAAMGCEAINAAVRRDTAVVMPSPETAAAMFALSATGPLWYRGLAEEPEASFAPTLTAILDQLGARAIVIGHTIAAGRMATRFDGRVIQIDTGMLHGDFFPGGASSALEIRGATVTAIYATGRDSLQLPARETPVVAH